MNLSKKWFYLGLFILLLGGGFYYLSFSKANFPIFSPVSTGSQDSKWLTQSTSAIDDPKAGAIFTHLFLQGEREKTFDGLYSHNKADKIPNYIFAVLETLDWSLGQNKKEIEIYPFLPRAEWRLITDWNSPKTVVTRDGVKVKPETVILHPHNGQILFYVNNRQFLLNEEHPYLNQIISIVEESIQT